MRKELLLAILGLFLLGIFGCSTEDSDSCVNSLAYDEQADNVAVMFADSTPGTPSAEAFDNDLDAMAVALKQPPYNFRVIMKKQAKPNDILSTTASAAASLKPNGTLLFFYSGHGDTGSLGYSTDTSSSQLTNALSQGHYGRVVMMIDACYSGSFVEGATAVQRTSAFNGLVIMTAAKPYEESADDGVTGFFARNVTKGLSDLAKNPQTKIRDLITWAFGEAAKENPEQTGDYRADPPSILDELLVGGPKPTPTPTPTATPSVTHPTTQPTITPTTTSATNAATTTKASSGRTGTCKRR